jgi:hypothetical protein
MGKKYTRAVSAEDLNDDVQEHLNRAINTLIALYDSGQRKGKELAGCKLEIQSPDGREFKITVEEIEK